MQKRLFKILTLTDLLTTEIDEPSLTANKETKEFLESLQKVQELGLPILDKFYLNKQVSKSTVFNTLTQKLNYNINKEFKSIK